MRRAIAVTATIVLGASLAACKEEEQALPTAAPVVPTAQATVESESSAAPTRTAAPSASSDAAQPNVPVVPGYAPGEFPPVAPIVLPDISLLTGSAPEFGRSISDSIKGLPGVRVSSATCTGGVPHATNWSASLVGDVNHIGDDTVVTEQDGKTSVIGDGQVVELNNDGSGKKIGNGVIVNNGDGTGEYIGDGIVIKVLGNGAGSYIGGGSVYTIPGDGSGEMVTSADTIKNLGDGSGEQISAAAVIKNNGDGSGEYIGNGIIIKNNGDGTGEVNGVSIKVKPLPKLAPVGKFPELAALEPIDVCGLAITFQDEVLFDFGSDVVRPEGVSSLRQLGDAVGQVNVPKLLVHGHTDSISEEDFNQSLSERRANAVAKVLRDSGLTSQIEATGFGESKPVAPNTQPDGSDNPAGRQLNRRAEIIIPAP
ncbi:OmpA family protein [Buchananella hordeovulneris]|uniref:OmpA-like domain-containing protein n=1 Tax=Buchananella hordeovulneris TaxID=52770 RepID=A0A1Q5PWD3_9ACTO|nr:OmpA family protein [Buchananella hordeovulneris]MDO5080505.1 OmpA family protein [Buchananella hordeovulneris]OKL51933.1 hypothetical protein BSZ40_05480 [Buchananella hordeovulneris]RRD44616.1 OmpA family protein [Buchananella hordeovulneris]RRD51818.1 OmpA family protein [Buchananella hordeovulneris]